MAVECHQFLMRDCGFVAYDSLVLFFFLCFNFEWHYRSVRTASIPAFAAIVENVTDKTVSDKSSLLYVMLVVDGIFFRESANRITTLYFALRLKVSKCCVHFFPSTRQWL